MSKLSTRPYKGVRDFYPEDFAIQRYIFATWRQTVESFGFEPYDASIFEPAELYRSKGAENEEIANEQTYTFTDRGGREVTLRPEMTPTVARMVAGRQRDLSYPLRWYSIPNLFRYERAQRGRLREHWQLNCDIFGVEHYAADVEIILLASELLKAFGATSDMFEIRVNNRATMNKAYAALGITNQEMIHQITQLNDCKRKIDSDVYRAELEKITGEAALAAKIHAMIETAHPGDNQVVASLHELGVNNVVLDRSIARGFNYYTGTVFEVFDTDPENNRAMLGGGRYDNLTDMFSSEGVTGIGFGMGDVTMRTFLESHHLLPQLRTAPTLTLLPIDPKHNLAAERIAQTFRAAGIATSVDVTSRKISKKLSVASNRGTAAVIVLGDDEVASDAYSLKWLADGSEIAGSSSELITALNQHSAVLK